MMSLRLCNYCIVGVYLSVCVSVFACTCMKGFKLLQRLMNYSCLICFGRCSVQIGCAISLLKDEAKVMMGFLYTPSMRQQCYVSILKVTTTWMFVEQQSGH